jgi:hypothetical protein
MRDPSVIEGYTVQARNRARQFANNEENIQKYGSVDAASRVWANNQIQKQTNRDSRILAEQNTAIKKEQNSIANWEAYKRNNNLIPGSTKEEVFLKKIAELGILKKTRDLTSKRLKEGKAPTTDLNQLMNVAYGQYMASVMGPAMSKAAVAYSQIDAEQTFEANPFKKMEHQFKYDMAKMRAKNRYDQSNIRLKNKLENATYGPAQGVIPLSEPANANITGRDLDQNVIKSGYEAIDNAINRIDQKKLGLVSAAITSEPGAFTGLVKDGQMTYNFYNPQTKKTITKTASLKDAFVDLSKPGQEAELTRIFKNVQGKLNNITVNSKDGSVVYNDFPNLQKNVEGINAINNQLSEIIAEEKQLLHVNDQFQVRLNEALDFALSSGQVDLADDVPIPMLTERQIAMAMDSRTNKEIKAGYYWTGGKPLEKYEKLDNSKARTLSQEEYEDVYVAMMKLPPEQRAKLEKPNASGDRDDYNFLTTDFGVFDDTESTAEKYWNYTYSPEKLSQRNIDAAAGIASTSLVSGVRSAISDDKVRWRFDEAQAREDARKIYSGSNSELDELGNYTVGDAGFLGTLNTVFKSPDAGGKNGLPTYNVEAVLSGQRSNEGVGQIAPYQYSFSYDQFSKSPQSIEQLNAMTMAVNAAPSNSVLFSIGDDRDESITDIKDSDNKENRDLAQAIFKKFINSTQFQYGKSNDREKRPVMNMTYVERMGGPDTKADYAGYTITPGSSAYGKEFESLFGEDDPRYTEFLRDGITVSIPSDYDSNRYSSKNQDLNATNIEMQREGSVTVDVPDAVKAIIFENPQGGGYQVQITPYAFNEQSGNISVDGVPYTESLNIDASQLDAYVSNLRTSGKQIAAKNNANESSFRK